MTVIICTRRRGWGKGLNVDGRRGQSLDSFLMLDMDGICIIPRLNGDERVEQSKIICKL
jgi:hypothetical protein